MIENELYVTTVSHLVQAAEVLNMSYCFYRLAVSFMKTKKSALYSGAAYLFVLLALHLLPIVLPDWCRILRDYLVRNGAAALAGFLVMCGMEKRDYEHKAFLAITFPSLVILTYSMTSVLYDNLYSFALETKYMRTHPDMEFTLFAAVSAFLVLMHLILMMMALRCIVKAYAGRSVKMSKKELIMLSVPSLACIEGQHVINNYRPCYVLYTLEVELEQNGTKWNTYDALILLYSAVSFVTIVVVIVLYRSIRAGQEEKMQSEMLDAQIDSVRRHIEQAENLYRDIRSIRHDMANHLFTLEKLYEENEIEEARAYSTQLKESLEEIAGGMKSGNPVTDVILQEVKREADKRGISFRSEFYYPADSKVNAFDTSVILHNALQNALENIENSENAHIFIRSYQKKNAYIIEISNSYSGVLEWNAQSGLPLTAKEKADGQGHGKNHGYGLSNIRRIARKYCGDIDITLADGEFRLSVMLML